MTRIVELDEWTHGATEYAGGWSEYEAERERRRARHYQRGEGYVDENDRVQAQAQRMQQWEERGYGQGRKKKKSKDVKKAFEKKLGKLERVDKPYEPWELQLGLAPATRSGDVVVRLERAVVERGSFRLGPLDVEIRFGDRLAIVGANGSGKTTLLDALLGGAAERGLALGRAGRRARRARAAARDLRRRRAAARRVRDGERASGRRTRARCSRSSISAPTTSCAAAHRFRPASGRAPCSRCSPRAASTASSSTSRRTISTSRRSRSSSARSPATTGTVLLVTHDRLFLERFAATRTIEL